MICRELLESRRRNRNNANNGAIDFGKYWRLPREGQNLIGGWFKLACDRLEEGEEKCFDAFVFAWIAFNGWASCITNLDGDRRIIRTLMQYEPICQKFTELCASDTNLNSYATHFRDLWPIFETKSVHHVQFAGGADRQQIVKRYFDSGASIYSPPCWQRHEQEGGQTPVDWPHTIDALYQVRCNLFHGEKALSSMNDRAIVSCAAHTLISFLRGSQYLR